MRVTIHISSLEDDISRYDRKDLAIGLAARRKPHAARRKLHAARCGLETSLSKNDNLLSDYFF